MNRGTPDLIDAVECAAPPGQSAGPVAAHLCDPSLGCGVHFWDRDKPELQHHCECIEDTSVMEN